MRSYLFDRDLFFYEQDGTPGGDSTPSEPTPEEAKQPTPTQPEPTPAKYTDKQLNDIVKRDSEKAKTKAINEVLDRLGVKSLDDLDALKELKESKMSEQEKLQNEIEALKNQGIEADKKTLEAEITIEAIKKGVSLENLDKIKKLAMSDLYEGETMAEKIDAVLKDFEGMTKPVGGQSFGGETKGQQGDAEKTLLELARKQAGLTK